MLFPRNDLDDSLHTITKTLEALINQAQTKAQETLEYKLQQPSETSIELKIELDKGTTKLSIIQFHF